MANTALEDRKLNNLIRQKVIEIIQEMFADPDYGMALRPDFIRRLKKSIESKKSGRLIPFEGILKKYQR